MEETLQKKLESVKQLLENEIAAKKSLEDMVRSKTEELAAKNIDLEKQVNEKNLLNDALKQSQLRLELLVDAGRTVWWEVNAATGEIIFHERWAEMLGYPPEKFRHFEDFMSLVHPDDLAKTTQILNLHLEGKSTRHETEYRMKKSDGDYIWCMDVGSISEKAPDGTPVKIVGFITNIDAKKKMELALAKKTEESENLFNASPHMMSIVDVNLNLIKVNKYWKRY